MRVERRMPGIGRFVFGSVMLALVGVLMAVGTLSARSATMPLGDSGQTLLLGSPAGGEKCWATIPSGNVPKRNNFLLGAAAQGNHALAGGYSAVGFGTRTQLVQVYNGTSFEIVPNPQNLPYQTVVRAVIDDPSEANSYWLVGTKNAEGGPAQTWVQRYENGALTEVPSPNFGTGDNILNDVDAPEPDPIAQVSAFIAGLTQEEAKAIRPLVLALYDGELTRETLPDLPGPGPSELLGVKSFSDGRAIAVGYNVGGAGLRNLALGRNTNGVWEQLDIPIPGSGSDLVSVDAISPNEIWAVGTYFDSGASQVKGYALRGTGSINNWDWFWETLPLDFGPSPLPAGGSRDVSEIDCVSEGNCVVTAIVASGSTVESYLLKLEGTTWTPATGRPVVSPQDRFETIARRRSYFTPNYLIGTSRQQSQNTQALVQRFLMLNSCYAPIATATSTPTTVTMGTPTAATSTPTATQTACTPGEFVDVPPGQTFYPFIDCLAGRGHVSGYPDCTFRPQLDITRGQIAKIVSNSAGFNEPVSGQVYTDVGSDNPFYQWINRLSQRAVLGGYPCGGPNEPCDSESRPYFRHGLPVTRGQTAKIVSNAAGFNEPVSGQTFEDVPPTHPFYQWIHHIASRGIAGGYECGGPGEPCQEDDRPYFRSGNNLTRGQVSKIVVNAFFPNCQDP